MSVAAVLFSGFLLVCSPPQDGLAAWIKKLNTLRDDVEPAVIHKIADEKSRPAMQALVAAFDTVKTTYMRREIVRALVKFDGVATAEQRAVEKIAAVATGSEVPELRDAAMESLGKCVSLGKHFLAAIVDSKAHDDLRLAAIRLHVERGTKDDVVWYRRVWNPKRERRSKEKGPEVLELESIREAAFSGLMPHIPVTELVATLRGEFNARIRRAALVAMQARGASNSAEMAKWLFKRVDVPGSERVEAAKILAEIQGTKVVSTFLAAAKKPVAQTPEDLRQAMAKLILDMNDESANKRIAKLIGRGKPHQKVFALQVTMHLNDPKIVKRIRRGLKDKSFAVRRATAIALAARGDEASLPDLRKMLARPRTPDDQRVVIEAIGAIKKDDPAWMAELDSLRKHSRRDVRNTALEQLGKIGGEKCIPVVREALSHADWTTRLVAIRVLEALRHKDSVAALVGRLPEERGRMAKAVQDALWNLTGQLFDESATKWRTWWEDAAGSFSVISEEDLAKAEEKRELRRLKQRTVTKAKFFGIRIVSHRVIFIIDTSGSMVYPVHGRYVGKRGATRIDVAKEELAQSIENLADTALFNIISFSSGVGRWLKSGIADASAHARKDALTFVERLGAGGATNLYDTIKLAFEDPDVDTLYVLSDGEPTAGAVLDPHQIREDVKFWNRHRRIKIHTIAIGGNLEILEWLAKDSGGKHVQMR